MNIEELHKIITLVENMGILGREAFIAYLLLMLVKYVAVGLSVFSFFFYTYRLINKYFIFTNAFLELRNIFLPGIGGALDDSEVQVTVKEIKKMYFEQNIIK